jgi:hypothetical protein
MGVPELDTYADFWSVWRRRRRPYLVMAILTVILFAGTAGYIAWGLHRDGTLDRTGVRTQATVEKVMPSTGDGDDRIRLTFADARGRRVVATTRVNDAGKYKAGDSVAIVYDRSNPHRVRTIGDAAPTWEDNLVIPVVVILILLPVSLYGLASSFRLRRLEKRSGSGTPMMLNVVCTFRHRRQVAWAVLDNADTTDLAVRIPVQFCDKPLAPNTPVTVKGKTRPGGRVIIHGPDRVILPLGRMRPKRKVRVDN